MNEWHSTTLTTVLQRLESSAKGITTSEAAARLERYGPNLIEGEKKRGAWMLLLDQFRNVLIITLLLATVVSAFLGHGLEALAIAVIVLFAVLLGFAQEFRAEKAIDALKRMAAPNARVLRDGREQLIAASAVVPGDIFMLSAGDRVPADGRLTEALNLRIEESPLTGESQPSEKDFSAELLPQTAQGDRSNMVFAGTTAVYGRGSAVAVATGMQTEFGRIADLLQHVATEKTPLQKNLDRVGGALAKAALLIVFIIVLLGVVRGQSFIEMLIFGIALAVAVVPEALPAVVTISLALGVQRMARRHALMRRLAAVETLGSTTVICSDKTGTLTRDEMTVRSLFSGGILFKASGSGYKPEGEILSPEGTDPSNRHLLELLSAGALCNDSRLVVNEAGEWKIAGDPTEGALLVVARKAGLDETLLFRHYPRIAERPFSSEERVMVTVHRDGATTNAIVKGAPESVFQRCSFVMTVDGPKLFDAELQALYGRQVETMARDALRVLAVAVKEGAGIEEATGEFTLLGIVGMIDPPRPEAKEAVRQCLEAGIRPVMITGDHPETAEAIASELGILHPGGRAVTGSELQSMSDHELQAAIGSIDVFARVSPEHKLRIVKALQEIGEVVAMTGDGVNDAPALKRADIGISMGITGTDVSREASAMMLTDDNFASIVAAVEEGRTIYDNIRKYLTYLLSSNIGELGLMAGATLLGLALPLSAVQILYVNLATDGLPALALAVDPGERDIMRRRPNKPNSSIFSSAVLALMLAGGIWSALVNILLFQWAQASGRSIDEAMTMTFVSLVLIQFFKAYNFRSEKEPIIRKPFRNRWLNLAIFWELAMLIAVIYLPVFHKALSTYYLTSEDWVIIIAVAFTIIPVIELVKLTIRRGLFGLKS